MTGFGRTRVCQVSLWWCTVSCTFLAEMASVWSRWNSVLPEGLSCGRVAAVPCPQTSEIRCPFMPLDVTTGERMEGFYFLFGRLVPLGESVSLLYMLRHDSWKQSTWHLSSGQILVGKRPGMLPACSSELSVPVAPPLEPRWSQLLWRWFKQKGREAFPPEGCFSVYCLECKTESILVVMHCTNFGMGLNLSLQK